LKARKDTYQAINIYTFLSGPDGPCTHLSEEESNVLLLPNDHLHKQRMPIGTGAWQEALGRFQPRSTEGNNHKLI